MKIKNTKTQNYQNFARKFLLPFLLFFFATLLLNPNQSKADDIGLERIRTCDPLGGQVNPSPTRSPTPDGLDYNAADGGKDFSFDQFNGYCLAVILPQYAAVKVAIATMNRTCGTSNRIPSPFPAPIRDLYDIARASVSCTYNRNFPCCAPMLTSIAAISSFFLGVKIQHEVAQEAFESTAVCGGGLDESWVRWNSKSMLKDDPIKKKEVEDTIYGQNGWIHKCNNGDVPSCDNLNAGLQKKEYRELYYGGVERQDNGPGACPDVTRLPSSDDKYNASVFDGKYPTQRYYLRGTEAGNYACDRFNYRKNMVDTLTGEALSEARMNEYEYAFNCCINRSRTTICLEKQYDQNGSTVKEHAFCVAGGECQIGPGRNIKNTTFRADYMDNQQLICARSYDLCPYNFNVGGGTLTCDYFKDGVTNQDGVLVPITMDDIQNKSCGTKSEIRNQDCSFNEKAGKCKNYCQYLNHCVVAGGSTNPYISGLSSPYFSQACIDFVGDSKNQYAYGEAARGDISATGVQKHFSAPIVQCVKETLENIFYNQAGHSKCGNVNEYPDRNGHCFSATYQYQKGKPVESQSFLYSIQDKLKDAIKIVLTISITMQGFKMLLTGTPFKHSEIIMYVIKIGLVLFFATGTAWQQFFFNGIYNVSSTFSTMVTNVSTSEVESKRDGCQFGKITLGSGGSAVIVGQYPVGKEYLAIFDTLDCKIARYLGFGPGVTLAASAQLILPSFFSPSAGAIGVFFAVFTMVFGILMIIVAIRALHIFLTSAFAIILLVYVSPITITFVLFSKTKDMFDKWLRQLIGYSLQPVFLFAYIGIFITVFETLVSGSATYAGAAPQKQLVCDKACLYQDGTTSSSAADIEDCDLENGDKIINPMSDSIACIMNLGQSHFSSTPVLQSFGVSITIIKNFFTDEGREKLLTVLKGLLVVYILVGFIDDIPGLSSAIMGGQTLPTVKLDPAKITGKVLGGVNAVTSRAYKGGAKFGGKLKEDLKNPSGTMGKHPKIETPGKSSSSKSEESRTTPKAPDGTNNTNM